jgi:hypothetical protein
MHKNIFKEEKEEKSLNSDNEGEKHEREQKSEWEGKSLKTDETLYWAERRGKLSCC